MCSIERRDVPFLGTVDELVTVLPGVRAKDVIRKPVELEAFIGIVKSAIAR